MLQGCLQQGATQNNPNEAFNTMIWNLGPKQGFAGAEVVELSAHLAAARFNHGANTLTVFFFRKWDALLGDITEAYVQLVDASRVRRLKSMMVRSRKRKILRKRRKGFEEKAVEPEAKPINLVPSDHKSCVFEAQTLCFLEECGSLRT